MTPQLQEVPLQPLPPWYGPGDSILGAHFGTTDYLLPPQESRSSPQSSRLYPYDRNESIWQDIIKQYVSGGMEIVLERFYVVDWFPRAPGLYHTLDAKWAREEAFHYLHRGFENSPIRDHAHRVGAKRSANDYTVVFTPEGKLSMLQGGIGSIRLKPIRLFNNEMYWLMTATSDGVAHAGVPIAVPRTLYSRLLPQIHNLGAVCATIYGELDFLDDPFSRLFDRAVMVPRLYLRVTDLTPHELIPANLETSVAVSFVSDYQGLAKVYATYVTFQPNVEGSFQNAVSWMKREYVEGEYRGRIITDFDQTRTIFPEARLALSSVMDRLISRGNLKESIELMHASASVDSYYDEIARRGLLSRKGRDRRTKVFISYAHVAERETGWVGRIRTHLEGLIPSSDVEIWDDSKIEPGQKWQKQIEEAINRTRIAVLVLTADFLASKFIREAELPPLLEAADAEGAIILCVYGSEVHLSGVAERLLQYQFVNEPQKPLQILSRPEQESIYKKLTQAVEKAFKRSPKTRKVRRA